MDEAVEKIEGRLDGHAKGQDNDADSCERQATQEATPLPAAEQEEVVSKPAYDAGTAARNIQGAINEAASTKQASHEAAQPLECVVTTTNLGQAEETPGEAWNTENGKAEEENQQHHEERWTTTSSVIGRDSVGKQEDSGGFDDDEGNEIEARADETGTAVEMGFAPTEAANPSLEEGHGESGQDAPQQGQSEPAGSPTSQSSATMGTRSFCKAFDPLDGGLTPKERGGSDKEEGGFVNQWQTGLDESFAVQESVSIDGEPPATVGKEEQSHRAQESESPASVDLLKGLKQQEQSEQQEETQEVADEQEEEEEQEQQEEKPDVSIKTLKWEIYHAELDVAGRYNDLSDALPREDEEPSYIPSKVVAPSEAEVPDDGGVSTESKHESQAVQRVGKVKPPSSEPLKGNPQHVGIHKHFEDDGVAREDKEGVTQLRGYPQFQGRHLRFFY